MPRAAYNQKLGRQKHTRKSAFPGSPAAESTHVAKAVQKRSRSFAVAGSTREADASCSGALSCRTRGPGFVASPIRREHDREQPATSFRDRSLISLQLSVQTLGLLPVSSVQAVGDAGNCPRPSDGTASPRSNTQSLMTSRSPSSPCSSRGAGASVAMGSAGERGGHSHTSLLEGQSGLPLRSEAHEGSRARIPPVENRVAKIQPMIDLSLGKLVETTNLASQRSSPCSVSGKDNVGGSGSHGRGKRWLTGRSFRGTKERQVEERLKPRKRQERHEENEPQER